MSCLKSVPHPERKQETITLSTQGLSESSSKVRGMINKHNQPTLCQAQTTE